MTKKRDTLTLKQEKLVKGISDNLGGKTNKPLRQIGMEAGYSKETADNPVMMLKSKAVQKRLQKVLATLDKAREVHLAELFDPEKVAAGDLRDHAYVYDILVKNQRLLSGESTENKAIAITISESIMERHASQEEKPA